MLVSLAVVDDSEQVPAGIDGADAGLVRRAPVRRRTKSGADRKSTGRERHDEKITVYVSAPTTVVTARRRFVCCAASRSRLPDTLTGGGYHRRSGGRGEP